MEKQIYECRNARNTKSSVEPGPRGAKEGEGQGKEEEEEEKEEEEEEEEYKIIRQTPRQRQCC